MYSDLDPDPDPDSVLEGQTIGRILLFVLGDTSISEKGFVYLRERRFHIVAYLLVSYTVLRVWIEE